ncbi:LysR family transcriptional regulator [Pseudomonas oryzihabitans]|uniref:LysR family transcriptional regulator n=1 Tax=Pseudomonas oryzihabitans TaxID=47885 RepID=UPI003EBB8721
MNLRFLDTFVWVARLGSFRLTAEKLSTTQAAISSRIAVLESELGVQLFLRDSRGVSLTAEGHRVLGYAERMLATQRELHEALGHGQTLEGRLRIGVMDTVIHSWLDQLIAAVTQSYPAIELELTADTALNLAEQLARGQLDLIFQTDLLRAEGIRNLHLASYPVRWLVATDSHLARPYANLAELAGERLITFSRHSRPHQDILGLLQREGIAEPRVCCINSVAAIIKLMGEGFGIGALPPALVIEELARGSLMPVPLAGPPPFDVQASWHGGAGLALSEAVVALSQTVVADWCTRLGPERALPVLI